jgi:hypothetical protein
MKSETSKKRIRLDCLGYIVIAFLLAWALYAATMNELARVPERDASANMEEYGLVTIRFSTDPHPPTSADTVSLSFTPMDSRQNFVKVDQITYKYGPDKSEKSTGSGKALQLPDSGRLYIGEAQFPNAGRWWIKAQISMGDVQSEIRFTVDVD